VAKLLQHVLSTCILFIKTIKFIRFLNQDENKDRPNSKSKSWNKKKRNKTQHVQNKNPTIYYCKEEMKTEQGYDKKMYSKLTLNRLKALKFFTSINILIGHLVQRIF
jgi:hypothetical protein